MEKSTTSVVNAKKVKNKKNKRLTLGQFVDRLSAVMSPYTVYDGSGDCRVFDVSHRGLENAIEYANQIGSAVLREAANGSGDEIIWNPLEQLFLPILHLSVKQYLILRVCVQYIG